MRVAVLDDTWWKSRDFLGAQEALALHKKARFGKARKDMEGQCPQICPSLRGGSVPKLTATNELLPQKDVSSKASGGTSPYDPNLRNESKFGNVWNPFL